MLHYIHNLGGGLFICHVGRGILFKPQKATRKLSMPKVLHSFYQGNVFTLAFTRLILNYENTFH